MTKEEIQELSAVNQSDVVVDRLYSAIEQFKAIITARPPRFRAYPREDSDNKLAQVWNGLLEYVWDISDGNEVFKQAVHDYATTGLGYFHAYLDPEADYGRGEIKFNSVDPFRVYVDPAARHRYFDDARGMLLSTILGKRQLVDLYPQLKDVPEGYDVPMIDLIDKGLGWKEEDYPSSGKSSTGGAFTPDVIKDKDWGTLGREKYRVINFYDKVKVPYFRLLDNRAEMQKEIIVDWEKFQQMSKAGAFSGAIEIGDIDFVYKNIHLCHRCGLY